MWSQSAWNCKHGGAGIVLSKLIDELGGRVLVFGTPAEETSGAKVIMAEKGSFNDVDVAMMAHPNDTFCESGKSLALEPIQFTFRGKTAHAASAPRERDQRIRRSFTDL